MLKKIFYTIIVFLILGIAGTFLRSNNTSITKAYKVFSNVVISKKIDEIAPINSIDIVEATNKERVTVGLPPLAINQKLNDSASLKVDDMIARQYFEHQSPTGEGVSDLGNKVGYQYVIMGENLAMGTFISSDEIVTAWMASPGHKANMLNKKYQDIGVSVKHGLYDGKEVWFAVQHFGTGRSACPTINNQLKKEIDSINQDLKEQGGVIAVLKKTLETPGAQDSSSYQEDLKSFNQKVDNYNNELQDSRQKIEFYNQQVKSFNKCIATFQ